MKILHISILSGICVVIILVIFSLIILPKTQNIPAIETIQIPNNTSSNTTNYIPSLRCSISCALQISEPANDTLLIVVPIEDPKNDAIWVDSHSKSSFYDCALSQYVDGNQTILKKYTEISSGGSDRISPINFIDGEKFVLECSIPHQTATITIPKCLSPSELEASYNFHILFPAYSPTGYSFQCGIGTYPDIAYYTYWDKDWKQNELYSKNLLNMRSQGDAARNGLIGIQVMNGYDCGSGNTTSANDTLTNSYGDACRGGIHYHFYSTLGTKDELLKMEQSMK